VTHWSFWGTHAIGGLTDGIPFFAQYYSKYLPDHRVIVDHQHPVH
jgi:hypothetical protein